MGKDKFDFSGYATKNDLKCTDGRTILKDAFKHQDGTTVPLVWAHLHSEPSNILGHAILENRADGVYCYGTFNDTASGKDAKELVAHGDISSLSIYANQLKEKAKQVMHGAIREVSLVMAGANPGAFIDNLSFSHADGEDVVDNTEAIIYTGITLSHGDTSKSESDNEPTVATVFNTFTDEQKNVVYAMISHAVSEASGEDPVEHDDDEGQSLEHASEATVKDVFDTLSEEQKKVVYYLIGAALEEAAANPSDSTAKHSITDKEGDSIMKTNVFDQATQTSSENSLSHDQMATIIGDAKRFGSLKESFIAHATEYGFDPISILFGPDGYMTRIRCCGSHWPIRSVHDS